MADTIQFDAERIRRGIVWHLYERPPFVSPSLLALPNWEPSVEQVTLDSVYAVCHGLGKAKFTASVKRDHWRLMTDLQRLGWLLTQAQATLEVSPRPTVWNLTQQKQAGKPAAKAEENKTD